MNNQRKNILLIEQDSVTARNEIRQLRQYGFDVTHTEKGEEAVQLIKNRSHSFDIILIDTNLEVGMNETQIAEEILKIQDSPIIFLFSIIVPDIVERTENIPSYGFVVKNAEPAILYASINIALKCFEERKRFKQTERVLQERIASLTKPQEYSAEIKFEDMFDLSDLQRLQDEFSLATGVASIITRPDGSPITSPSNFCDLCMNIIRKTDKGLSNCMKSDAIMGQPNQAGPNIQPCLSGGLWDAGAAITVGGRHVANWLIGQVRNAEQTEEKMRSYAQEIGANEEQMVEAFQRVPAMSLDQFKKISGMLYTLATLLSDIAYKNIQQARFITEFKKSEEGLQARERRFSQLIQNSYDTIVILDAEGIQRYVSPSAEQVHGFSPAELVDIPIIEQMIHPEDQEKVLEAFKEILIKGTGGAQYRHKRKSGGWVHLEARGTNMLDNPDICGVIVNVRDITDRKLAEEEKSYLQEQLHQSQKMDAIGQLAGGVAHDFNNALSGIIGSAEMLKIGISSPEKQKEFIEIILSASSRAAELTKKLLTFSRHGARSNAVVDVSTIIKDTIVLLKHTIDKSIMITYENKANFTTIIGDDSLLQNAFMNMGINSSHAMSHGGILNFTLDNLELSEEYCKLSSFDIKPGKYLEISIRDNGCGIPPEIISRIFEPFFTTKHGLGTGLGLAAVYGTVQEHKGAITVYSETEKGTVFHIYLPATDQEIRQNIKEETIILGTGTVLVIDDEELIRTTASELIKSLGYQVMLAENGLEGVNVFREFSEKIDLIILDMIMPVMNGRDAFSKLREISPAIPIVISSGFAKEDDMSELKKYGINGLLSKPFRKVELADMIGNLIKK